MTGKEYFYFVECSAYRHKFHTVEEFYDHIKLEHPNKDKVEFIEWWLDRDRRPLEFNC